MTFTKQPAFIVGCRGAGIGRGRHQKSTVEAMLEQAVVLNDFAPTFTRATSKWDSANNRIVGAGVRARRSLPLSRFLSTLADHIELTHTNLLPAGTSESFSQWTTKNNETVVDGATTGPDGVSPASSITRSSAVANCFMNGGNTLSVTSGQAYTMTVFAKAKSTSGRIGLRLSSTYPARVDAVYDLNAGTVVGSVAITWTGIVATIESVGNGWYRCRLTGVSDATVGTGAYLFGPTDSTLTTQAWEGISAVLADAYVFGAMVEAAASPSSYVSNRNLLLQSEAINVASWSKNRSTITADSTANPLTGLTTADTMVEDATATNTHSISQVFTKAASSLAFTYSIYFKAGVGTRNLYLQIDDGGGANGCKVVWGTDGSTQLAAVAIGAGFSGVSATVTAVPGQGGWYRGTMTCTTNSATSLRVVPGMSSGTNNIYSGDSTSSIIFFGQQLEYGTVATGYWANSTAIGLRATDSLSVNMAGWVDTRTNRLIFSEQFDNAAWVATDTTITANALADPNGNSYADLFTDGVAGTASVVQTITIPAGSGFTFAAHLKLGNNNWIRLNAVSGTDRITGWFNISAGTVGTAQTAGTGSGATLTIVNLGNGWYRCALSGIVSTTQTSISCSFIAVTADLSTTRVNGATWNVWGASAETSTSLGDYLPTAGTAFATPPTGLPITNGTIIAIGIPYGRGADGVGHAFAHCGDARFALTVTAGGLANINRDRSASVAFVEAAGVLESVAATWDAGIIRLYGNGVQLGTVATVATSAPFTTVTTTNIGDISSFAQTYMGHVIVIGFRRTLSAAEILTFWNGLSAA